MDDKTLWQAKLAARLHDPIEKALILMRTAEGHEGDTSAVLRCQLGLDDLSDTVRVAVQRADYWATAADRAAFPNRSTEGRYPGWQNVRYHEEPVIIHPLTGEHFDLGKLCDIDPLQAKEITLHHFEGLIQHDSKGAPVLAPTALAFWRFGPDINDDRVCSLWAQLPADTRVPDHNIFDQLDFTAALASCFALDTDGPALLAVSLGPVQSFIAASRSTSDLWAGSHLLSRLSWEAMKVVCERLGPEAILFPRLRGVPQVDLWLREERGLSSKLFEHCEWTWRESDANPLFAAALPNRFTALVPAGQARELAEAITEQVRRWALEQGEAAYRLLLDTAGIADKPDLPGYDQLREQFAYFPEVHWAVVPWSLVETNGDGKVEASSTRLAEAMQPFFKTTPPGYLGTRAWQLLSKGVELEQGWLWRPNPGTLYPALHELLERVLASAKSVRSFRQTEQQGWRDSLSGEAEWLTTDRNHLNLPPGKRSDTLWAKVAGIRRAWAKEGEHLSALNTLKRLWPTLFVNELKRMLNLDLNRYVVSTHTMAIATSLANAIDQNRCPQDELVNEIANSQHDRVPLPRALSDKLRDYPYRKILAAIPGWLESVNEGGDEQKRHRVQSMLGRYLGAKPEAYYGLVLMDGDNMGAWLSAARKVTLPHLASFHPNISAAMDGFRHDQNFAAYAKEHRTSSPSRHMAISEALNHFALTLAPDVVERQHHGRILYAGGDDLMAMLPVRDLLPAMAALRAAYSGTDPAEAGAMKLDACFSKQANGFVLFKGRLLRVMGEKATASCGAVIAHHQAPLGAVLRELRVSEQRAKNEGDRNAFSLTIVKRSGGALRLTAKWGEPMRLLIRLRDFFAEPDVSRRAVYNSSLWLRGLPEPEGNNDMVSRLLAYQFKRQSGRNTNHDSYDLPGLTLALVDQAIKYAKKGKRLEWIENFLAVAEFLARETRHPKTGKQPQDKETAT